MGRAILTTGLVLLATAGCASTRHQPTEFAPDTPTILDTLINGSTSRDQVLERLGPPTSTFEAGRILTYRLNSHYEPEPRVREDSRYCSVWHKHDSSLVLVFDESGRLVRHRLLRVR